jgi:hypothetical protein
LDPQLILSHNLNWAAKVPHNLDPLPYKLAQTALGSLIYITGGFYGGVPANKHGVLRR